MVPFCQGNKQRLVYIILTGQTCTNAGRETKQSSIPTIPLFHYLTICIYHSNKPKYNCRWIYLQRNKLQILHLWVFLCASSCRNGRLVTGPFSALGLTSSIKGPVQLQQTRPPEHNSRTWWQDPCPPLAQCRAQNQIWNRLPSLIKPILIDRLSLTLFVLFDHHKHRRRNSTIEIRTKLGCLYLHQWLH